jgi:hypothetical protein
MGQMHQLIRETVILNWNEKSYTNPVMTFNLIFVIWGTLLLEYPPYVFRNKESKLQENATQI